jgi:antitoxin (DNA-binding transcriptional repressor) of toxin-antitoxin stability system
MSRTLSAEESRARCLQVLDQVAARNETVVVTKRRRRVAQVAPIVARPKRLWGAMKGEIEVQGDIVSPLDVKWEAMGR